jgi:hypothetical protein
MAMKLKHLRSGVANVAPTQAQIDLGQIAINYEDERLFIRNTAGEVVVIASSKSVTNSLASVLKVNTIGPDVSGNVTLGPTNIGANGVAPLGADGKVPTQYLPESLIGAVTYQGTWDAATNNPTLPAAATVKGEYYVVTTAGTQFGLDYGLGDWVISNGVDWQKVDASDAVTSVAGKTGAVVLAAGDIASGVFDPARLGATPGNSMMLTTDAAGAPTWVSRTANIGVTSVGLIMPSSVFTVFGSPVTGASNLSVGFNNQPPLTVLAGPTANSGVPAFRVLTAADIPALDTAKITTGTFDPERMGSGVGVDKVLTTNGSSAPVWVDRGTISSGTVTSVGILTSSVLFQVSNSPITTAGNITLALKDQAANTVLAGPAFGTATGPTFRALVQEDIPTLDEGTF